MKCQVQQYYNISQQQHHFPEIGEQEAAASRLVLAGCYLQPGSSCFSLLYPGKTELLLAEGAA